MSRDLLKKFLETEEVQVSAESVDVGEPASDEEVKADVTEPAEEIVEVVEAPAADLGYELAELAQAKMEQDEAERDVDALVEAQESLEAYAELLRVGLENGGISAEAASFLRVGLERFEAKYGLEEPLTPSVEAFGGTYSQRLSTTLSLEKFSENLKKAWEAFKRAMQALWSFLKDVYTKAVGAAARLEKRADNLRNAAKDFYNATPSEDSLVVGNPARLVADGTFMGDNVDIIAGLLEYTLNVYPEKVIRYADEIAQLISRLDPTDDESRKEVIQSILDVESVFESFPGKDITNHDNRFGKGVPVKRSAIFPGNRALYVSYPEAAGVADDGTGKLRRMQGQLRVEMLDVPEAKAADSEVTIRVKRASDLAVTANKIASAAGIITRNSSKADKVRKAVDQLVKAGDTLKSKVEKAELGANQDAAVNALLRSLNTVQKMLGSSINGVLYYGITTLSAQLALVERQLDLYRKAESKKDKA